MSKHTPGDLTFIGRTGDGKAQIIESDMKRDNWDCCRVEVDSDDCNYDMAVANTHRIVALWNAMKGVDDPEAFVAKVLELVKRCHTVREQTPQYVLYVSEELRHILTTTKEPS